MSTEMKQRLDEYWQKWQENRMLDWKHENPAGTFHEYIVVRCCLDRLVVAGLVAASTTGHPPALSLRHQLLINHFPFASIAHVSGKYRSKRGRDSGMDG
jgi:hypothetical protein